MATKKVIQGEPIVLDLSRNGGGQLYLGNNLNDNKIYLEGYSSDGNGHAADIVITGRADQMLPKFTVKADTTLLFGRIIDIDLSSNGGGHLMIRNDPNDNKIYLEGFDRNANENAEEMLITGKWGGNLPRLSIRADTTHFTGDIVLDNADCAEEFEICDTEQIEPGTVMVLGEEGKLEPSRKAYDKRVAGVISGAGDYKPGIVLDKQRSKSGRKPVALLGKVFCKVDAQYGAIEVGDLLTTAPTRGHAMKVDDPLKAFGTVIGKALRPFVEGQGLIPILIALQ